ncbi:tetratricopeptide repeat protein [Silvimonas sp.]|uniref:tetratricopeptide repeat protein n=1 Tax=Silvimonas sp. TaxID=2650811 RepID=UPI0028471756|nr:tetratricopeptide repeat protein [Silvimonas sp.]MDR3428891.1 tetratricopeptide repeat protein [Silvimonas sp.]
MRWIASLFFALATTLAFALPSEQDVQAAVRAGDYAQAQTLMAQVVEGKPGSAKAHYVYAEILAHNGRFADATNQALQAKTLDPQIRFTNPDKFHKFEAQLLNAGQADSGTATTPRTVTTVSKSAVEAPAVNAQRSSGFGSNWLMIALLVAAGFAVLIWLTRRREPAVFNGGMGAAGPGVGAGGPVYGGGTPAGYGYGNGPVVVNQGGSGLGAGLAGAAGGLAAGVLIGEMLDHRGGGLAGQPGVVENNTYIYENGAGNGNVDQQLESQPVDFGNGNDWDNSGGSSGFSDSALDIGSDDSSNW